MDTLRTQRARKLAELFKKLRHPSENIQDRLSLLNEVSEALCDENTTRIIELENLFQRERELLLCNLTDDSLEILRQRELIVFMDVIKDEDRNKPESKFLTNLQRIHRLTINFLLRAHLSRLREMQIGDAYRQLCDALASKRLRLVP